MSIESTSELLQTAAAIAAVGFYATKPENKPPEIACRVWKTLSLSHDEAKALVDDLNTALAPVLGKWKASLLDRAHDQLTNIRHQIPPQAR